MIIDKELEFSDGQAITADAASTNVVDLGQTNDVAPGVPLHLRAQVDEAFNNLTSLNINVQTDSAEGFGTATTLFTKNVALADLTLGADIDLGILTEGVQQYLRLQYDVVGTNPTTGEISAFVEVYNAPEGNIGNFAGNL